MKKYMPISKELFEDMFTEKQKEEIKSILKVYDRVHVVYENGKYHFSSAVFVTKTYALDHEYCGEVYAEDIFTVEERIVNFAEAFHEFLYIPGSGITTNWKEFVGIEGDWSVKFKVDNNYLARA